MVFDIKLSALSPTEQGNIKMGLYIAYLKQLLGLSLEVSPEVRGVECQAGCETISTWSSISVLLSKRVSPESA